MGDMKLGSSSSSMTSEISSQRSNISQSRYYLAPNLAAHKIGKKKKKAQTKETKITIPEENSNKSKEGILKLPTINSLCFSAKCTFFLLLLRVLKRVMSCLVASKTLGILKLSCKRSCAAAIPGGGSKGGKLCIELFRPESHTIFLGGVFGRINKEAAG
jgi:hypothetical protein